MAQSERTLAYMQSGRSITPTEADDLFACKRLGARIYDLKQRGERAVYPGQMLGSVRDSSDTLDAAGKCEWKGGMI